jgi:hypothetical protein
VLDNTLNRMHNHWHLAPDEKSPAVTFTASQEGSRVIVRVPGNPPAFVKLKIADGATGQKPTEQGAGEVKTGQLRDETRLLATVEPMHGNMAVVYIGDKSDPAKWQRRVLDDTLGRGHALWLADLDADGDDEIVVGHSDPATGPIKGPGVYVYDAEDADGAKWTKHVIDDGGMATEDAFALDLTGDGKIDILAGGRNTHNVKLYINKGE